MLSCCVLPANAPQLMSLAFPTYRLAHAVLLVLPTRTLLQQRAWIYLNWFPLIDSTSLPPEVQ